MGNSGYISASGAMVRQRELDVVANNIANVGTPGFKRGESIFESKLESSLRDAKDRLQPGAPARSYVATAGIGTDHTRGPAQRTGSPLNVSIQGEGFFEVETERGLRYTRGGNFVVNPEGQLALPSGEPVLGDGAPIAIPDGYAEISPSGLVSDVSGNALGNLSLHEFANLDLLQQEGLGLYRPMEGNEKTLAEAMDLLPGSVESSNVKPSRELAAMVLIQRAFETNMRAMQVDDESTQQLIEGMR